MRKSVPSVMPSFSFLLCLLLSAASISAPAAPVDGFLASAVRRPLPEARSMTASAQVAASSGWVSSVEPRLGVPTFFWSAPAQPGARTFRAMGLTAEQAARRYLVAHAELYRASPGRWAEARMWRVHDLGDQGAVIVSFQQRVRGVRVFRDEVKVIMNSELQLVAIAGYLTPEVKVQGEFLLTDTTAVASAYLARSGRCLERTALTRRAPDGAGFARFDLAGEATPVRVRPVYFPMATAWSLFYQVELELQRDETGQRLRVARHFGRRRCRAV